MQFYIMVLNILLPDIIITSYFFLHFFVFRIFTDSFYLLLCVKANK